MMSYKKNNIVFKNCYSYKLKSIAKTMYEIGLLNVKWVDEQIGALDAIIVPIEGENMCKSLSIKSIKQLINYIITFIDDISD